MEELTVKKLYSQKGISIATFIGGPLAAGYLMRQNFKALDKEREGLISVILGIVFTVLIFLPLFILPEETIDKIPNQLIPLIYTSVIYFVVEATQGSDLKKQKKEEKPFESNWKATGIGFLWMIVMVFILGAYIFTLPNSVSEIDQEISLKLDKIIENEEKALGLYRLDLNTSTKEELISAVKDEGILLWTQNLKLLQEIEEYDLEKPFADYISKLSIYTRTRLETYILIMKSIEEDTDKYGFEIDRKNKSIEAQLKEIESMAF